MNASFNYVTLDSNMSHTVPDNILWEAIGDILMASKRSSIPVASEIDPVLAEEVLVQDPQEDQQSLDHLR